MGESTDLLRKMQFDWDTRARENARYYVNTGQQIWSDQEFFQSGDLTITNYILNDMTNVCQGRDPKAMRVLEIGCGAGRVTRGLARLFGSVYAVDISGEMVGRARQAVRDFPNAHVFQNNGMDLAVLGGDDIDFAFSSIVFQHIPSREIIETYVREVHRVLRPGCLFKFQVQGDMKVSPQSDDTRVGVSFSDGEMDEIATRCGFEARYRTGSGTQEFWLWFFKR